MIRYGTRALRLQCLSFPLVGWITMCNMMMQTMGKGVRATILSMSRQGLFFIPLVLTLPAYFGLFGVQVSQPISDVVSFLVAIPLEIGVLREMTRDMQAMEAEAILH